MIEPRGLEGKWAAQVTLEAMENVSLVMAGAQLGITICTLTLGAINEPTIARLLEVPFAAVGVPEALQHPMAFAIALSLVTYPHVVVGEMVPKNIALAAPERSALVPGPLLMGVVTVLRPLLWIMNGISNGILRPMRVQPETEATSVFTRNEVAALVAESRHGGLPETNDERLLLGVLTCEERSVNSILIPISKVTCLPSGMTTIQAEIIAADSHSRFPMLARGGSLAGYIHIKDLDRRGRRRSRPSHRDLPGPRVAPHRR